MNGPVQQQMISLEVLSQRQQNTDHAVQQLQNQFSASMGKLESQIAAIGERMAQQGRPNWSLLGSMLLAAIGLVGALWAVGVRPIEASIRGQSEDVAKLESSVAKIAESLAVLPQTYISRQEWDGNRLVARQDNENKFKALDEDVEKLAGRVEDVRDSVVPRGEHEERWRSQDAAVQNAREEAEKASVSLQRQIDEVKESLGGIYGARDVIRDIQARMDRLEVLRGGPQ